MCNNTMKNRLGINAFIDRKRNNMLLSVFICIYLRVSARTGIPIDAKAKPRAFAAIVSLERVSVD